MANSMTLDSTEEQYQNNAWSILSGMSHYRINPIRLKMTETGPHARGGQGTITFGTLLPPESSNEPLAEQIVAVKKLEWTQDDAEESTKFFKSFVHELSLMTTLSHTNIIKFVGFVEDMKKGDAWIILPWEGNGNVREFLQSGEWDIPERISLIQDTAKGLEYLHVHDPPICHGDLKSLNILVNSNYRAVITDFGSARIRQTLAPENQQETANDSKPEPVGFMSPQIEFNASTLDLTLTGPKFSLRWTAPEVLDEGMQDLPSDIWAIGWICWEIVTGRIPFDNLDSGTSIIMHTMYGRLPATRKEIQLSNVLALCGLMTECWDPQPANRIDAPTFQNKVELMPSVLPSSYRSGDRKRRSADLLHQLGNMYRTQCDREKAEYHYQASLEAATRANDDLMEGRALASLGDLCVQRENFKEAEELYERAYEIHGSIGHVSGVAKTFNGLGAIYRTQSKFVKAEQAFQTAHQLYGRANNDAGAADTLRELGEMYHLQSKYVEAERAYEEARDIHCGIGNDSGFATTLLCMGNTYYAQWKLEAAKKSFMEASEIYRRIGDDVGLANTSNGLGQIYCAQSKYHEAEKVLKEAHEIYSRVEYSMGVATVANDLGNMYRVQSRDREAEKIFNEALETHSRIGNKLGVANSLHGLGEIHRTRSRNREAEKVLNDACKTYFRIGHHSGTGHAFYSLGLLYKAQGRYNEAEESFRHAIASYERGSDSNSRARTLMDLGDVYQVQQKYVEAEESVTEALAIGVSVADEEGQALAWNHLSDIFKSQSKHTEEKDALSQAEALLAQVDPPGPKILDWLGAILFRQEKYSEAEEYCRLAQAMYSSMGEVYGEATTLTRLGAVYILQTQYAEAEECLARARVLCASLNDEAGEAKVLDCLLGMYIAQRRLGEAKVVCMQALEMYKRMGRGMSDVCWEALQKLE